MESTPNAALVYTLAIGKDKNAIDAYSDENQFILERMEEAESVSARKAALLDPTEEDETVKVLRRRLFTHIDDNQADQIIEAYRNLWDSQHEHLPQGIHANRVEAFRAGFPLHPELIETLKEKTSTLSNFQRVRGMLRILARTVFLLWKDRPTDACAIHLHHINPAFGPIRQEVVTKLDGKGMPCYELWARNYGPDNLQLEIWQLPSAGTPHINQPVRIAGLHGRNLALVEHRVLRRLARAGIRLGSLTQMIRKYPLHEDLSLNLGLLFRVLAPMRSRQNMQMVTDGIEAMGQEEAAYWLGMAMHRKHPRRVLMALRFLLIDPKATGGQG